MLSAADQEVVGMVKRGEVRACAECAQPFRVPRLYDGDGNEICFSCFDTLRIEEVIRLKARIRELEDSVRGLRINFQMLEAELGAR